MKHFLVIMSVAALGLCGCEANAPDAEDAETTTSPATNGETPATGTDTGTAPTPAP